MSEKHQCSGQKRGYYLTDPLVKCSAPGKYEEGGKWYCGRCSPARKKARQDKKNEEWRKDFEARLAEALRQTLTFIQRRSRRSAMADVGKIYVAVCKVCGHMQWRGSFYPDETGCFEIKLMTADESNALGWCDCPKVQP